MREEMVTNGLNFLQHPNVQATPLSERVSFLEKKGLTKEEIQEAIERHQTKYISNPTVASNHQLSHVTNAARAIQYQTQFPAYARILWTVSSLVGAASILSFLWNFAVQSGYIPWLRPVVPLLEASKLQEEKEQEAKKDEALLAELSSVSSAIQQQTEELAKLSVSLDKKEHDLQSKNLSAQISSSLIEQSNWQSIAELKAEISTLKALLLSKSTESISKVEDNIEETKSESSEILKTATGSVNPQQPPYVVPQVLSKAKEMMKALKEIQTENSLDQLKIASDILIMYVTNLIENPDVPRYRRIAPGNANFKQKVEPLKHHEELLKSIGFETVGLNMEWKWHTASKTTGAFDDNIAILRALLKALKSLSHPKSSYTNFSLEEIARTSLDKFVAKQEKIKCDALTIPTTQTEQRNIFDDPSISTSTSLDAFMERLEQQTTATNSAHSVKNVETKVTTLHKREDVDEENLSIFTRNSSQVVRNSEPSYPKSFTDIVDLIQKGEPVPGIRDIEEKLSVDTNDLLKEQILVQEAVTKPWEKCNPPDVNLVIRQVYYLAAAIHTYDQVVFRIDKATSLADHRLIVVYTILGLVFSYTCSTLSIRRKEKGGPSAFLLFLD
ncbi:Peroxisomal membrane anchor protein (peroxin) [Plasmopara halstedii]|uniref:Peroxisomal membrane protein PEX14 n=1 Tax=Plasmopara halstedii TaxID=4781 RepID=A0A0P1AUY6_PLAHL|nr:Peroxisomal membrane anchor protein (peroxin) [Plasmopara halstedii]CEG44353.1 Peroxisomal membrane anchor protein (peroxin) [Plasmopara halstedii]|eukprot:XP_024580722.1 Peroxisomal membrane anchor protein (peroxin) [Plasmopara halstedii]